MKLQLENINHRYGNNRLLSLLNIDLSLGTGVTGLLGVNGAGKSTLLNIIATIFKPTSGTYLINGQDAIKKPQEVRKSLGYLPQNFGYIPEFSPLEFLNYMGTLKGASPKQLKGNIEELLTYLNLSDVRKRPMKNLSGGMRQRVGIAQALLLKPKLLILDEPMVGLDPNERNAFTQMLTQLAKESTILISSHIIDDIENLCERVVMLEQGQVKMNMSISELLAQTEGHVFEALLDKNQINQLKADAHYQIVRTKLLGDKVKVRYVSTNGQFANSQAAFAQLEDAFILNQ